MGLRVDQVLQGSGTTNTGNITRACFQKPQLFAECLDIDTELVKNISIILSAFKSKQALKLDVLQELCLKTYSLHYEKYSWARMNPTLHKLLQHGCEIARCFPIPMAYYAEDANEAWHKLYRRNMTEHSRQNSRKNRLHDVFNRAVYMSDPKISLIKLKERERMYKKRQHADNTENIRDYLMDM